jgi:hypothetical protein
MPIAPTGKSRSSSKKVIETFVNIKVEGTQHARTHSSRTDRWLEDFDIPVDKANEVEIAIYDKQVGDANPVPIGLLWVRINDLVEATRRQKVMMEAAGQGGWVTANAMPGTGPDAMGGGMQPGPYGSSDVTLGFPGGAPGGSASQGPQVEGVEGWFAVEPVGAIYLNLSFGMCQPHSHPLLYLTPFYSQRKCSEARCRSPWWFGPAGCRACPQG